MRGMWTRRACMLALGGIVACTLTTDFDGLVTPAVTTGPLVGEGGTDAGTEGGSLCKVPVDFENDPKNCGSCGHDCLGGRCAGATCEPHVLANDYRAPIGIALAGGFLWVGHQDGLDRLPLIGGEPTRVVPNQRIAFVTADATTIYYANPDGSALHSVPIAGGPSTMLRNSIEDISGIAVSSQWIFFSRPAQSLVQRDTLPISMKPQETLIEQASRLDVHGIDWNGGSVFAAASEADVVLEIAAAGTGERREVMKGGRPFGVKVDGDDVFVARRGARDLVRVPRAGGKVEVLASNLDGPAGIAVAPNAIYFTEEGGGRVLVLARRLTTAR